MVRYFKPRKDVEDSYILFPQKIERKKQYRYMTHSFFTCVRKWIENYGKPNYKNLKKNFIEVKTEKEAIEGF